MRLVAPALVATHPFQTVGGLRMSMGDELRSASGVVSIGRTTAAIEGVVMQGLLVTLGSVIAQGSPEQDLVAAFEREVQRLLRMRTVRLREIPVRYQVRLVTPTRTAESIVLGVPNADARVQVVLEATCDSNRDLDEHDYRVLGSVAQLAGLVLEASRGRTAVRSRPSDDAAPLIGSTAAMKELRSRIERVALTDFTVLIEGESGVVVWVRDI